MHLLGRSLPAWLVCSLALAGCNPPAPAPAPVAAEPAQTGFEPVPTRGYILISIDALRADHLGLYGYPKPTSPFLDELARRATVFDHAFAQVPSTLPSHMSMFTGLYPAEHGVFPPSAILAPEIRTLPEVLLHAGFRTAGHTEGGYVQGGYGFARGFGEWSDTPYADDTDVERTFGRGVAFLKSVRPGERFFLFLHTYTVHDPYWPPERYRKMFWPGPPPPGAGEPSGPHFAAVNNGLAEVSPEAVEYFKALYDASIRYLDDRLRQLFADLEASGLAADTTVILTADHGEEFLEHGSWEHQKTLYEEVVRIPLIVSGPEVTARRETRPAGLLDIAPTILDFLKANGPPTMQGVSLLRPLADTREMYGETDQTLDGARLAFLRGGASSWKAILRLDPLKQRVSASEWYDLATDPLEKMSRPPAESLRASIEARTRDAALKSRSAAAAKPVELSPEQREKLRALGYIGR